MRSHRSVIQMALFFLAAGLVPLPAGTWEDANAAFAGGDFAKAGTLYQELIDREGPSPGRLYNLGNTLAKLNQPGPAVLNYERAALLAPRDADIRTNLKLTRPANAITLAIPPPWWTAPLYWLSLNEWSWLAALGMLLLAASILMRQFLFPRLSGKVEPAAAWSAGGLPPLSPAGLAPRRAGEDINRSTDRLPKTAASYLGKRGSKPPALQSAIPPLACVGIALALPGGIALQQRYSEKNLAIITAGEPILRLSPFPTADPVEASPPLPGQRVIPGKQHGDWVHLTIPGSTSTGWIAEKDIALIIPNH